MLLRDVSSRFINLYSYFLFCIKYFLLSMYFLIIKFSIAPKSIIVFFIFLFILILICSWAILIKVAFLLTETILQYFFWPLLLEKSNCFSISPRDIFFNYIVDYLDRIFHIFCVCSGFRNYPLYIIVMIFVYNLWFILTVL